MIVDFGRTLRPLSARFQGTEVVSLILWEMIQQLGVDERRFRRGREERRCATEMAEYPHLQAAAHRLLQQNPERRHQGIDDLLVTGVRKTGSGWFWMPEAAARQVAGLVGEASSVRCAFPLALNPALHLAVEARSAQRGTRVEFVSSDPDTCELAELMALALEVDLDVVPGDPLGPAASDGRAIEAEIVLPPFAARPASIEDVSHRALARPGATDGRGRLTSEVLAIANALVHVRGRSIVGVSNALLFRAVGVEEVARDELVRSGRLGAVLAVPPGMAFLGASIPTSFLIVEGESVGAGEVRFVDLSGPAFAAKASRGRFEARADVAWADALQGPPADHVIDVPIAEIRRLGSVLTIERYLGAGLAGAIDAFLGGGEAAALVDLVEMIRPGALPKVDEGGVVVKEAAPADVGERGFLRPPRKTVLVDRGGLRQTRNQALRAGDVVLSVDRPAIRTPSAG